MDQKREKVNFSAARGRRRPATPSICDAINGVSNDVRAYGMAALSPVALW